MLTTRRRLAAWRRTVRLWLLLFLAAACSLPDAAAQTPRQVVARYASAGAYQAIAFVDGAGSVDDALLAAFAESLQTLAITLYSDDRFDLQSGSARFLLSVAGGRTARAPDGTVFLHFGVPPAIAPSDTLDGVLYPAQSGAPALPPRLSFTLVQTSATTLVRTTWHAVVVLRAVAGG
jgi:hypothetical protein